MSARRAARAARVTERPALPDVPLELLAGACLEVWPPVGEHEENDVIPPWIYASGRHSRAVSSWLEAQGIVLWDHAAVPSFAKRRDHPWSFARLQEQGQEAVAEELARRGLPPDWTPAPLLEEPYYGPSRITHTTYLDWKANR